MRDYSDIINMPHHVSKNRPQMSMHDRAAQFAPFAALTGYDDAVKETARLTDRKTELLDEQVAILNEKILLLIEKIKDNPEISIIHFVPDQKKEGGTYKTIHGIVKKIDEFNKLIIMNDGKRINMESILDIEGNLFSVFDQD